MSEPQLEPPTSSDREEQETLEDLRILGVGDGKTNWVMYLLKEIEKILVFQVHTELYAAIVAFPTLFWCIFQALSQRKLFETDFNKWEWYDVLFYTLDSIGINGYLLSYPYLPLLLAYGPKKAGVISVGYIAYIVLIAGWSSLASAILRRWIPLVTLLLPLYVFAIIFVIYLGVFGHFRKMLKWWKTVLWYIPFLVNLFLVDAVILGTYFQFSQTDSSLKANAVRLCIRLVVVPIFTYIFTFTARYCALVMDNVPNNQRLALTADMTGYRAMINRILMANAGNYRDTFIMLLLSSVVDWFLRVTSLYRDMITFKAIYWTCIWPVKTVVRLVSGKGAEETMPTLETLNDNEEGVTPAAEEPDYPMMDSSDAAEGVDEEKADTDPESAPSDIEAAQTETRDVTETGSIRTRPRGASNVSQISSLYQSASARQILASIGSSGRIDEFELQQVEIAQSSEMDMYQLYSAFITTESIVDSACIISVTFMTFAYHIIFNNADQHELVRATIVCALQILFAFFTDLVTSMTWSFPQLLKAHRPLLVTVWDNRASNILLHIFFASWSSVMFFTYRVFMALGGQWHK